MSMLFLLAIAGGLLFLVLAGVLAAMLIANKEKR